MTKIRIYVIMLLIVIIYMIAPRSTDRIEEDVVFLSHDTAREMCEEKNLTYDYEAEGYVTADFCY